jgi:hypothetical protein
VRNHNPLLAMMAQIGIAFAQDDRLINREDAIVA